MLSAIRTLAYWCCLSAETKEKACRQARHQADNLAKLWFEFLSVLELIAQILCAVVVQKSSEAFGNTHTCVLMLPQRRFLHKIAILRAESKLRKLNSMSFETHSAIKPHFAPPDSYVAPLLWMTDGGFNIWCGCSHQIVIARRDKSRNVAIKATAAFRSAGFLRRSAPLNDKRMNDKTKLKNKQKINLGIKFLERALFR